MGRRKKHVEFMKNISRSDISNLQFYVGCTVQLNKINKPKLFIGLLIKSLGKTLLHFAYLCIIKQDCCERHLIRNHPHESIGNRSTGLNNYLYKLRHFYPSAVGEEVSTVVQLGFLWCILSKADYYLNTAQKLKAFFGSLYLTLSPT